MPALIQLPWGPVPEILTFHSQLTRRAAHQHRLAPQILNHAGEEFLQPLSLPWGTDLESWPWGLGDGCPRQAVTQAGWVSWGAASTWG